MRARTMRQFRPLPVLLLLTACGGGSPSPSGPSSSSFLTGTWSGTVTIAVNPGDPGAPAPTSGPITLDIRGRAADQSADLSDDRSVAARVAASHDHREHGADPGNTAPAQISTQGQFDFPRAGAAARSGAWAPRDASRIEADFTGVDCNQATFTGSVVLTKN